MKLKDILLERRDVKAAELKRVRQKVFNDLKRNLKSFMNRETLQGNAEHAVAKALKLRVIDIKGGNMNVPIEDMVASIADELLDLVRKIRK